MTYVNELDFDLLEFAENLPENDPHLAGIDLDNPLDSGSGDETYHDDDATDTDIDDDTVALVDDDLVTFADLGLTQDTLRRLEELNFKFPTPIQAEAIPALLAGSDVVGVAQTGTGKTAAFGLPLLEDIDPSLREVQALILAPTRELAMQTQKALSSFAANRRGLQVLPVYGGAPYGAQLRGLKEGAQVVVGTPGRIIDLLERDFLKLDEVRFLVLDEADEMLRMGFAEDVDTIAARVPKARRTALFSATMPPEIRKVAHQHMHDPVQIAVTPQSSTVDTVHQTYAVVPYKHKNGALARVLSVTAAQATIVFVRTRMAAEEVASELINRNFNAAAISGDVAQRERERIVERLRSGALDILVATDVAARGLDVERVGLVVNFDVPKEAEAYVHRIGRTGRAGRQGEALTFLTPRERSSLRKIERLTGTPLEEVTIPSPREVSAHKSSQALTQAKERIDRGRLDVYYDQLNELFADGGYKPIDIAAALLALKVGDDGPETWATAAEGRVRREEVVDPDGTFVAASFEEGRDGVVNKRGRGGPRRDRDSSSVRYRLEVGHRDGVQPGAIVGAITGETGLRGSQIGAIEIFASFALVDIDTYLNPRQLQQLSKARVAGRALRIREDQGPGANKAGRGEFRPRQRKGRTVGGPKIASRW